MAGEQEIITKFRADVSELNAAVDASEKKVEKLEQPVVVPVSLDDKKLTASLGSAAQKFRIMQANAIRAGAAGKKAGEDAAKGANTATKALSAEEQQAKKTAEAQKDLAGATNNTVSAGGKLNIFQRIGQAISGTFKSVVGGVRDFGLRVKEGFQNGVSGAGNFKGAITQIGNNIKALGSRIRASFTNLFSGGGSGPGSGPGGPLGGITRGLDAAGASTTRFGGLLRGLASPIGLLVGASAAFLLNMTRLDSVKVILDGVKRGVTGILDQLAAGKFSISGFFDAFQRGQAVAKQLDDINDRRQAGLLLSKQEEEQVDKLLVQSRNRTLAEKDRVALLKQAQDVVTKGSEREIKLAQEEADLQLKILKQKILDQNTLTTSTKEQVNAVQELTAESLDGLRKLERISFDQTSFQPIEIDDETVQAAVDAVNKVRDARIAATAVVEQAQNRIDLLTQQGDDKRAAAAKKQLEQLEKEKQRLDKIGSAQEGLLEIRIDVQDEGLKASVNEVERAVLDSDERFRDLEAKAKKLIAELAKLDAPVGKAEVDALFAEIERQRASAESAIRADANAKTEKEEQDAQKRITGIIQNEGQRRLQAIQDEYDERLKDNDKFIKDDAQNEKNRAALLRGLDQALADERLRQQKEANAEQLKLQEENIDALSDFIVRAIELSSKANDVDEAARQKRLDNINADFAAQLAANEAFDQSEQNRARKRQAILTEQAAAIAAERDRIAEEDKAAREARSKEFINFLLDELEKIILINAAKIQAQLAGEGAFLGPAGVLAGLAQGAVFALLIKALFAGVKAAVQGAYTGEELVGQGEKPLWSGRDGYLRRVHKNEGIVDAETNVKYLPFINAMRKGEFERFVAQQFVIPRANRYMDSDDGHRMAISVMPAKFQDKNMVTAQRELKVEARRTNELLSLLVSQKPTHRRGWSARPY